MSSNRQGPDRYGQLQADQCAAEAGGNRSKHVGDVQHARDRRPEILDADLIGGRLADDSGGERTKRCSTIATPMVTMTVRPYKTRRPATPSAASPK